MPIQEGKRVVTVTVKVNAQQREEFQAICDAEDRSMSYVVRELALRGLAQYKNDGVLRINDNEEKVIDSKKKKGVMVGSLDLSKESQTKKKKAV